MLVSPLMVPIVIFTSIPIMVIGLPIARAYAKRMEQDDKNQSAPIPNEVTARLERMEQALDTIAIEVERISEGQRFTTKLLSERTSGSSPVGTPERRP